MKIKELNQRPDLAADVRLHKAYIQFEKLLHELSKKELNDQLVESINQDIETLNVIPGSGNELKKAVRRKQLRIVKAVEKELKVVPKNYYRNLWLAVGMSVFGLPIGVVFGLSVGNISLLSIGLPIGMAIGVAVGSGMDKKAFKEGRQLDVEIKY